MVCVILMSRCQFFPFVKFTGDIIIILIDFSVILGVEMTIVVCVCGGGWIYTDAEIQLSDGMAFR